jgi:hypothetical protein
MRRWKVWWLLLVISCFATPAFAQGAKPAETKPADTKAADAGKPEALPAPAGKDQPARGDDASGNGQAGCAPRGYQARHGAPAATKPLTGPGADHGCAGVA